MRGPSTTDPGDPGDLGDPGDRGAPDRPGAGLLAPTLPANLPAAFGCLPDGVVVADSHQRVGLVNDVGGRLLGRPPGSLLGRHYADVLPLSDPAGRDWWRCTRPYDGLATRTRQPERQLQLDRGNGQEPVHLLVTARYVRSRPLGPVELLVVCLRGVGSRERAERSRAELVSTVAHELRSPLTSVKGFTATLLSKWERFTDDQKRLMLETVNADADRVTRLINELLDVSRIDAGRLELRRQPVDVPDRVRRAFAGLVASGQPGDRFTLRVEGDQPELWADPDKIDQMLSNLLDNAVRHGGGQVVVTVEPHGDGIAVTVTDDGPGIAPETVGRVFTKFWRSGRRGGTGLGLYIVKGLVEAHGGTIEAGQATGGGARFRFTLPAGTPLFAR